MAAFLGRHAPGERQDPASIERQSARSAAAPPPSEQRLASAKGLGGEALTIADIAAGCTLGYPTRFAHLGWRAAHPQLAAWADGLLACPSFTATAPPAA